MSTVVLCYAQPLKNGICTASEYFFKLPLSVTPIRITIPVIRVVRVRRIRISIRKRKGITTRIETCTR